MLEGSIALTIVIVAVTVCCSLLITAAAIAIPIIWMRKKRQQAEHLAAVGTQGEAKILSMNDTGMLVNNNPRVTLELEVTMPFFYTPQYPFISWLLERFPNAFLWLFE